MKKLSKKLIVFITIIAVLGVSVLTLGLITIRQDKYFFTEYSHFFVYAHDSNFAMEQNINEKIEKQFDSVSYSVLRGVLEGQFNHKASIKKDFEGEPIYLSKSNIEGMMADSNRFLLFFNYKKIKSIKVGGQKYLYDRAYVFIGEGSGEIVEVRVIPFLNDRIHDGDGDNSAEFYKIPDLRLKMRTSKLFVTIENAIKEFNSQNKNLN